MAVTIEMESLGRVHVGLQNLSLSLSLSRSLSRSLIEAVLAVGQTVALAVLLLQARFVRCQRWMLLMALQLVVVAAAMTEIERLMILSSLLIASLEEVVIYWL